MTTPIGNRSLKAPEIDPGCKEAFDAMREKKLIYGFCPESGFAHHYPRQTDPFSMSEVIEFREASGEGTLYSYSVMRTKEPYVVAYVTLAEGPTMLTNIVDCDADALKVGQKVKLAWAPTDDETLFMPVFTPA
ncbi:OB-fold domain-containing protein [Acetobacteraceae bacterium H6797]|nr:OB-fold domain-containing protein [Acetobacteraceae bacterium H6797]